MSYNVKCHTCGKTVYQMERMDADGLSFHKNCMKCEQCQTKLSLGNYASLNGKYYCKTHFKQLFKTKGNYTEGFGEEDAKKKWSPQVVAYNMSGKHFGSPNNSPTASPTPAPKSNGASCSEPAQETTPEPTPVAQDE